VCVRVQVKDENRLLPLCSLMFTGAFPLLGREQKVYIQPKLPPPPHPLVNFRRNFAIIAADFMTLTETAN